MGMIKWEKRITASTLGSWEGWEREKLKLPENSKKYMKMKNTVPTHPKFPNRKW
jgi:hypothetical protein